MFDNVGKGNSEATKRQVASLFTSIAINGGIIGLLVYLGKQVVEEVKKHFQTIPKTHFYTKTVHARSSIDITEVEGWEFIFL